MREVRDVLRSHYYEISDISESIVWRAMRRELDRSFRNGVPISASVLAVNIQNLIRSDLTIVRRLGTGTVEFWHLDETVV